MVVAEETQMQQHVHSGDELTAAEAAPYLGVEMKALTALLERYGVGRYYEARGGGDPFVYSRADLDKIKQDIGTAGDGGPG
jgi:hypothetical protein